MAAGADAFPKHSGLTASVKGFLKLSLVSRGKKRRIARFWFMVVHRPKAVPKVFCFQARGFDFRKLVSLASCREADWLKFTTSFCLAPGTGPWSLKFPV